MMNLNEKEIEEIVEETEKKLNETDDYVEVEVSENVGMLEIEPVEPTEKALPDTTPAWRTSGQRRRQRGHRVPRLTLSRTSWIHRVPNKGRPPATRTRLIRGGEGYP